MRFAPTVDEGRNALNGTAYQASDVDEVVIAHLNIKVGQVRIFPVTIP
jgi:hypothetical protein